MPRPSGSDCCTGFNKEWASMTTINQTIHQSHTLSLTHSLVFALSAQKFRDGNPPHPSEEQTQHQANDPPNHQPHHQHKGRSKTPTPDRAGRDGRDGKEGEGGGERGVSGARRRARTPQARAMGDDELRLKLEARVLHQQVHRHTHTHAARDIEWCTQGPVSPAAGHRFS